MRTIIKILQTALKVVPFVGEIKENLESRDRGIGNLDPEKLMSSIIRIAITIGTTIFLQQ